MVFSVHVIACPLNMRLYTITATASIVIVMGAAMWWFLTLHPDHPPSAAQAPASTDAQAVRAPDSGSPARPEGVTEVANGSTPPGSSATAAVSVGATTPGQDDVESGRTPSGDLAEAEMRKIGRTPAIDQRAPGAASVVEALRTGKHPERLSVAIAPAPFDAAAFQRNPEAYLAVIEPGRVFQTRQPGPDVPALSSLVEDHLEMTQGGQVELVVRAAPLAPVSFTSLDLGIFAENTLSAITVRADKEGIARVHLKGMPGTIGEVSTLVGSPLASGQLRLLVSVNLPDAALSSVVKP